MTAKVICRSCRKLIETLPQLLKDEKDAEKVAECAIDHWYDGWLWINAYHAKQTKPPEEKNPIQQMKDQRHSHANRGG